MFAGAIPKGFPRDVAQRARDKLVQVDAATSLQDLGALPGNSLEKFKRYRKGQHGIRINDQWRICFTWGASGPEDVEVVDYHGGRRALSW